MEGDTQNESKQNFGAFDCFEAAGEKMFCQFACFFIVSSTVCF